MLDAREIDKTIAEITQGKTTFDNCSKLASLLIVRDYLNNPREAAPMVAPPVEKTYNSSFTLDDAYAWTRKMHNEDGTMGEHWNIEQVKKLMAMRGINHNAAEIYAVMNSIYSDYYKVLKKYGFNSPEGYLDLAMAWLNDRDATPNKAELYYKYIVK